MKKILQYYGAILRINIQREMEHRSALVSWGLLCLVQIFSNVFLIKVLLDRFDQMAGWSAEQLIFMYGISQISQGCMQFFLIQTWNIEEYVISGNFDRMFLRPISVLFQFLTERVNFIGLFNIVGGIVAFVYGALGVQFYWGIWNVLQLLLIIMAGTLLQGGLFLILGCATFYFKRTGGSTRLLTNLCEKTSYYPVTIFPKWMQFLLLYVLPYSYVAYMHSYALFQGDGIFNEVMTMKAVLIGIVIFSLAVMLFYISLKKYESVGH